MMTVMIVGTGTGVIVTGTGVTGTAGTGETGVMTGKDARTLRNLLKK
jgi:hypothetical protein